MRVGMDGDVNRESAVFDIQPRSGVCSCNYSRLRAEEEMGGRGGGGEEERRRSRRRGRRRKGERRREREGREGGSRGGGGEGEEEITLTSHKLHMNTEVV